MQGEFRSDGECWRTGESSTILKVIPPLQESQNSFNQMPVRALPLLELPVVRIDWRHRLPEVEGPFEERAFGD